MYDLARFIQLDPNNPHILFVHDSNNNKQKQIQRIINNMKFSNCEIMLDYDYKVDILREDLFEYSIKDVLKKDKWIIMEHGHQKYIYDLTEWIPKHPGGDIIMEGIKANKYYVDSKKYKKSPMMIFSEIKVHEKSNVFENYFIKENENIKLVGVLK